MNMRILSPLCLLLCWMLSAESMSIRFNFTLRDANQVIPLSMVEDSVDDLYMGCNEVMRDIVEHKYFKELHVGPFEKTWKDAEKCVKEKFERRKNKALTKKHMQAICVYTGDDVYKDFNNAVRINRDVYTSTFQFHILHYYLTSAIQILNQNDYCQTSYRRSRDVFTGKVDQKIRFGFFASSSYKTNQKDFGSETCFKIKTCLGAFIQSYSQFVDEGEVLIPPYETFKINGILRGPSQIPEELNDCKVVFVLESAGVLSNVNCKAACG
ncbi:ecto-ADP-ribosyltransferase 5-like [Stegastes partitus]|uniref:NAD(P)(+)--arginine ADP-ribosyltransferase n=1 Tax=Stegastes partitus TaxID=144197 RepID=A0A3B5AJW3_9TELE|nr:PREDICTED: ecto-ADP-ribosyltransferase 5-like [Stegastes partitus]